LVERNESERFVTMEKFGACLAWFGSLSDPKFLAKMRRLMSHPWFHGDCGSNASVDRLAGQKSGTYLIRFSSEPPHFTASKVVGKEILHQRILNVNGQFELNGRAYESLEHFVVAEGTQLGLIYPCNGSRFQQIFIQVLGGYIPSSGIRK
jgi:hypothetical protein